MKLMNLRNKFLIAVLLSVSGVHCVPEIASTISETLFKGDYVSSDANGMITIKQKRYPKFTGVQNFRLKPRIISELLIDEDNDMPYHLVDFNNTEGPFEATENIEVIIDSNSPFDIIGADQTDNKPYSSIGRLEMLFPKGSQGSNLSTYYGSGAALDKNLVITAAHNFLPPILNGQPNTAGTRAEEVTFHHMLVSSAMLDKSDVSSSRVSTHCFIHPEWEKNFNPNYDVALLFLSESLKLTEKQNSELLKLKIFNGTEETLRVVGYPKGQAFMRESSGKEVYHESFDSENIIYHLANTLRGSSGSPILSECNHIIGTHTTGHPKANTGVRMRLELLPFIDHSIKLHQQTLDDRSKSEEVHQKERERKEQELVDKGIAQGITQGIAQEKAKAKDQAKEAMIKVAKSLKGSLSIDQIKSATGLTISEINAI